MDLSYFYQDVEVQKHVGDTEQQVEGVDQDGQPTTYTKLVPQYETVVEQRLRSFTDIQPEAAIKSAMVKHKGQRDDVLERLFNAWQETLQWEWFESYQAWLAQCEDIDEYNQSLEPTVDEEGNTVEPELAIKPDMPVRPVVQAWGDWCITHYAELRQAAYPSIKEQLGMQFDDMINGTSTWLDMQDDIKTRYPKP